MDMNGTRFATLWIILTVLCTGSVLAQDRDWPRTVTVEQGTVTLYEPQVDELTDDSVSFRAALAWRPEPGAEPVFGVGWFEADVVTNRFAGTVHPLALRVTEARFPADAPELQPSLAAALASPDVATGFSFSLAELQASLAGTQAERQASANLKTAPPKILYRDHPALLVTLDGAPVLREIENSPLEAVINTPYPLIHDGRYYWLNVADGVWYRSNKATGPYSWVSAPPRDVAVVVQADSEKAEAAGPASPSEPITAQNAPEIIVSTEPAELIVTNGPAAFVPLVDDLLVLRNSDDDVFMHVSGQDYYVVLSGRWYRAPSLNGPWSFQAADRLPPAFANIPLESEQADSRVYVAGTEEATEAVLDAQLPQTAAVARGYVDLDVVYDGNPEFVRVDGTDMLYARNTGSTVLRADGRYYLVEDGVWYVASGPTGPWEVAVARPDAVRYVQPSSPVYPVKYVYIYDYTPRVVYVGYTPGYLGSYVYYDTVFYGSGWTYRPWVSPRYYYPYQSTWGFHVNYNPWSGWGFGLSWYWGPFSFNYYAGGYWHQHHHWYHPHYSYWGPRGYRPYHGHYAHRKPGYGGHRPAPYQRHSNLYRDGRQHARVVRTHDRTPRTRDFYRPDIRASRQVADLNHGSQVKRSVPSARSKYIASAKPVRRADLKAKADRRDLAYRKPTTRTSSGARHDVGGDIGGAGSRERLAPVRPLKRETLNDLGKLKSKNDARRVNAPKDRRPGDAARGVPKARTPAQTTAPRTDLARRDAPVSRTLTPRQKVTPETSRPDRPTAPTRAAPKTSRQRTQPIRQPDRGSVPALKQRQAQVVPDYRAPQTSRPSAPARSVVRPPTRSAAPQRAPVQRAAPTPKSGRAAPTPKTGRAAPSRSAHAARPGKRID
jgi:hypothetical protein